MKILGIETSCDETAAAVIEADPGDKKVKVLSNVVASSLKLHAKTGGVIPEVAARQQIKYIIPVVEQSLIEMGSVKWETGNRSEKIEKISHFQLQDLHSHLPLLTSDIDAIAVTVGPGLIGSLLVGVETAKTLAFAWNKPIIPVNHLFGHIYANFIQEEPSSLRDHEMAKQSISSVEIATSSLGTPRNHNIRFPFIALIVSGGHTDLLLFKSHKNYKWLGGTRDDAAGEALDKIARILGLSYPGGPIIEQRALKGNPKAFNFPRPMLDSDDFDFSFSGLKTAVLREVFLLRHSRAPSRSEKYPWGESGNPLNNTTINNLCASVQQAIIDVLVKKTIRAAKIFNVSTIVTGGGVSANESLRSQFKVQSSKLKVNLSFPEKIYTTDNAAMIATTAFFQYKEVPWVKITANPELYFD